MQVVQQTPALAGTLLCILVRPLHSALDCPMHVAWLNIHIGEPL